MSCGGVILPSRGRPVTVVQQVSIEEARNQLEELLERVSRTHEPVVIGRPGKPAAALVDANDLALLDEVQRVLGPEWVAKARETLDAAIYAPSDDDVEIVEAVKATRKDLYRERYASQ